MTALTLNIKTDNKLSVIVGGGAVALRKIQTLLAAGSSVSVVALSVCPEISELNHSGAVALKLGSYVTSDLDNAFLVVAATNDESVNKRVCNDAMERSVLVAVVDNPSEGNVTFPALLKHGDLEIAVSTNGRCPTFAVDVRDKIAEVITSEHNVILNEVATEREKLLTNGMSSTYNKQVLRALSRRLLAELTECKDPLP